jgi:hypothetical protein
MSTPKPTPLLQRRSALALAAALLALPGLPACATDASDVIDSTRLRQQTLELSVIDRDSGSPLAVHRKEGRAYVAGQPATRYAIRLRNLSGARVLVVLSVDGVNVISGETAAYGQTGYVLDPGRSYDITGWRKSDTAVAAFEFAALADSYAALTGRPGNVGVIGAAVFAEKPAPPPPPMPPPVAAVASEKGARAAAAAAPSALANLSKADRSERAESALGGASAERLGTAHGQREWSVSRQTQFERLSKRPQQLLEIHYDSRARLVAAGVISTATAQLQPRPFPDEPARGFVPDPPPR